MTGVEAALKHFRFQFGASRQRMAAAAAVVMLCAGCLPTSSQSIRRPGVSAAGRAERGSTLLTAAAVQLNDLPSYVDTELRRPSVILDSRRSADGKDVVAVCISAAPDNPEAPVNVLIVPEGNAQFRALRAPVKPGDIVKFYIKEDETLDEARREEMRSQGMERLLPVDLKVAQVLHENALVIEGGLDDRSLAGKPGKIEIWRYVDDRLDEINERLTVYERRRLPPLGWEPSPDEAALKQIIDRLNQWARQSERMTDWRLDPLLDGVAPEIKNDKETAPRLAAERISALTFDAYDGRLIQEAVWFRDIARWAPGQRSDDLSRAERLFDWTVRNIQLEPDGRGAAHRPWQILLYGRGTSDQRAWVFAMLCRQQGLDVVVLTPDDANLAIEGGKADAAGGTPTSPTFSLPAVLIDRQLYVFDARLGLPIPGSEGTGIATLEQLRSDDSLLRRLDLDGAPYPLSSENFDRVTANIVADEFSLSLAAFQLERKLPRESRVVLSTNASAIADRLHGLPGVALARLWPVPFEILRDQLNLLAAARMAEKNAFEPFAWRPHLWKARVLQFHGRKQSSDQKEQQPGGEVRNDHAEATALYGSPEVRPSPREVARSSPEKRRIDTVALLNAAYWLGLMLFDDGKHDVAYQWLSRPELLEAGSPWATGAHYNLARTLEEQGRIDEAVARYEKDATSPQAHGNRLRAKWLLERSARAER